MPILKFKHLACIEQNDHFGTDEVYFRVNDLRLRMGMNMETGGDVNMGPKWDQDFRETVKIELYDINKGVNDSFLGEHTVSKDELGKGEQTVTFDAHSRGKYVLRYEVVDGELGPER